MRRISIWDVFEFLPDKRQQRLKNKMEEEFEIEIDLEQINIVHECEESVTAEVPSITEDNPSLYIKYCFRKGIVTFYYLDNNEHFNFFQRILKGLGYIFTGKNPSSTKKTIITSSECEKIADYLVSIVDDITGNIQ